MPDAPRHMTSAEFREYGRRVVDWIADYWDRLEHEPESFAVLSRARPGEVLGQLPDHPPLHPGSVSDVDALLRDLDRVVLPALTHWQHPHFYAYFPSNISGPAVLGELLSAGLGVQGMLWATSPACTEVETGMMDWLARALGLPESFLSTSVYGGGVIQGTASDGALVATVAARERARKLCARHGHAAPDDSGLVVYCSSQAHSSITKAAMISGISRGAEDRTHVRLIEVDNTFRMRPDALEAAMTEDLGAGRVPCMVCATVGTTASLAMDPVREVADVIARHAPGTWLHVDAAHAGSACVCPEHRGIMNGVDRADSLSINPHKWLLTNFDCGCFWTRAREELVGALSITPEYLRNRASDEGRVIDYRDWQVALGRRFRALKLWMVLRWYGVEGLRAHIRGHVRVAETLEAWIRADPRFELCAPRELNLVCFRPRPREGEAPRAADARSGALLESLNRSGRLHLSHCVLPGVGYALRIAVGGVRTGERHAREAWGWIVETFESLDRDGWTERSA